MSVVLTLVALRLGILLCSPKSVTAITAFNSTPQSPSYAVEGQNITLEWTFVLDGTLGLIQFFNVTESIGSRFGPGTITVNKQKYQARFSGEANNTRAEMTIFKVERSDESTYRVNVISSSNNVIAHDVKVVVLYQASITSISVDQTAKVGDLVWLNCTADGLPEPSITWTILSTKRNVSMPLNITRTQDKGFYTRCTADNGIGNPATADVFITVHYPVKATGDGEIAKVAERGVQTFVCPVDGNPEPNIEWYSEKTGKKISSGKQYETGESGCYFCVASNYLGPPVNITHCLTVDLNLTLAPTTTVSQQSTASAPSTTKATSAEPEGSAGTPWVIIGGAIGGIVVLAIVVGVLTGWVHKQRKCRKDTKSKDQTLPLSPRSHETANSLVCGGQPLSL